MAINDTLRKPLTTAPAQKKVTNVIPFRDDINADKERASRENIAQTNTLGKALQEAMKQEFKPDTTGIGTTPPAFKSFQNTLKNQNPAFKALQQDTTSRVQEGLTAEPAGLGLSGERARTDLAKSLDAARQTQRAEAIRAYGAGTGQVGSTLRDFDQEAILTRAEQGSQLAAADEEARRSQSSQALQDALNLVGIGSQQQTQKDIAAAQIGSAEKMQGSEQAFAAGENALSRELDKYGIDTRIQAETALQASDQAFLTAQQQRGYLNETELTNLRAEIESNLLKQGFTQEQAMQIADQKHQLNIQSNDQAFNQKLTELDQSWRTGERVGAQEHEEIINGLQMNHETMQNELQRVLQLDIQSNDIAYRNAAQSAAEAHDMVLTQLGLDSTQALQASQQVFEREMTNAGFDQQSAILAAQLTQDMNLAQMNIDSLEQRQTVELAQQNDQFAQSLGLDKEKIGLEQIRVSELINQNAKEFDLTEKQVNAALSSQGVADALNAVSVASQLFPDDEGALKPFADRLFETMGKQMGMSDEQIKSAIQETEVTASEDPLKPMKEGRIKSLASSVFDGTMEKSEAEKELNSMSGIEWGDLMTDLDSLSRLEKSGLIINKTLTGGMLETAETIKENGLTFEVGSSRIAEQVKNKVLGASGSIIIHKNTPYKLKNWTQSKKGDRGAFATNLITGEVEKLV